MTLTIPFTSEMRSEVETPATGGVVVGFDGTPASHSAIETAAAIADANGWPVHVVSVLPPMSSYKPNRGIDEPPSEIEDLRVQLREAAIREAVGETTARANWIRHAVIGNSGDEIATVADRYTANLIILGRGQRRTVAGIPSGETIAQVMRRSSVPVLLVEDEMQKPSTVVAAVDFSMASERAAAASLQMLAGAGTLYLVHVEESSEMRSQGSVARTERYSGEILGLFRRLLGHLRPPSGVIVETIALDGTPAAAIAEFCERAGADLLAVGTRRLPSAARAVLGSVSLGLARKVRVPILIAPATG